MSGAPFKVKAVYAYTSEHDDDLSFPEGQIITITEDDDPDWYTGEYSDASGAKSGLFPRNFVERFEPVTPPRPARATHQRQPSAPVPAPPQETSKPDTAPVPEFESSATGDAAEEREEEEDDDEEEDEEEIEHNEPQKTAPVMVTAPSVGPTPAAATKSPLLPAREQAPPPVQSTKPIAIPPQGADESQSRVPPVASKPSGSSFRDRIAAFNKSGAAAPQAPPKPGGLGGGGGSSGFVKKTYMAPPPARNAYVPPTNQAPVAKIYRRDEDPEFARTQGLEEEATEQPAKAEEPEEEQPKPMSLKERMALLKQQQLEQQARHADLASKKTKPKPPPKKVAPPPRTDTGESDGTDMTRGVSQSSASLAERPVPPTRILSHDSTREIASPEQEQEQEEAAEYLQAPKHRPEDESTSEAEDAGPEAEVEGTEGQGEEGEDEGEDEDEDMDPEVRRRMELRERMAKMSGGMGMGPMFGATAMPGMGGARKPPKPKSTQSSYAEDAEPAGSPPQAVPVMPGIGMPGMALPGMGAPKVRKQERVEDPEVTKEDEDQHVPLTQRRAPEEVPDMEDVEEQADIPVSRVQATRAPPPAPPRELPQSPEIAASPQAAPPVPSASRPQPSGVDMSGATPKSPIERSMPPLPQELPGGGKEAPFSPPQLTSPPMPPSSPPMSTSEKRASRAIPPIPSAIDTSAATTRAPPPPPSQPPRNRQSTDISRAPPPVPGSVQSPTSPHDGDDYDPYNYEANPLGVSTPTGGRTPQPESGGHPFQLPPIPTSNEELYESPNAPKGTASRGLPPMPPHTAAPKAIPPPPPPVPPPAAQEDYSDEEEEESESEDETGAEPADSAARTSNEFHHAGLPSLGPHSRAPPPPPPGQAPISPPMEHAVLEPQSAAPRAMPPPPPQPIVQEAPRQTAPPPPPPSEPAPRKSYDGRKSLDILSQPQARRSVDIPRPSADVGDFMASDVDLGPSSGWWTQRKAAPPSIQGRNDILIDYDESSTMQDVVYTTKHVYVLYMDYSQTIITARYAENSSEVDLQQRHEPPPAKLRQDQLEAAHGKIGTRIAATAKNKENQVIGDGTPLALVHELLRSFPEVLPPVGTRAFGALVYANIGNASTQQHDEIRPGDIVSFRNAKLQGHRGGLKSKYSLDLGEHVGVVVDWDGTKKKVRAWDQGLESKKVKVESFKLGDLRSGEVKIWRVMSRDWVGWGST